jgi:hypothetical protein
VAPSLLGRMSPVTHLAPTALRCTIFSTQQSAALKSRTVTLSFSSATVSMAPFTTPVGPGFAKGTSRQFDSERVVRTPSIASADRTS